MHINFSHSHGADYSISDICMTIITVYHVDPPYHTSGEFNLEMFVIAISFLKPLYNYHTTLYRLMSHAVEN